MKVKELRDLSDAELQQRQEELRRDFFEARKTVATGKLENPLSMRMMRRERAKVLTILRERVGKQGEADGSKSR